MGPDGIFDRLAQNPVVAAVKDEESLAKSLASVPQVVFVLYGDITSVGPVVHRIHEAGKLAVIHLDLIDGFSAREAVVEYVKRDTAADGIISTRGNLVKRAHELGLIAIRRFFLLDSRAMESIEKQLADGAADLIEVLPGVMPKVLEKIRAISPVPFIAGGLIADKEDVMAALSAGAVAISSTNPKVWTL